MSTRERDKILFLCLGGFAIGVLARSFFDFGTAFVLFVFFIAGALFLVGRMETGARSAGAGFALLPIFLVAFALGMLRFDLSELSKGSPLLDARLNEKVSLIGTVVDEPDERENSVRLTVALEKLGSGEQTVAVSSKVLVISDLYPKFSYGDRIEVVGLLAKPKNFADAGGKIFDYQAYLAKEGIYYQITRPRLALVASGQGNFLVEGLFKFKQAFLKNISTVIPEPHASLLGGLVVGAKQSLGKNLLDDFRHAGVIHIVVLSGYNITIVADAIIKFFSFIPKFFGQALGAFGIIFFAIMTGGSATIIRASIMALLVILARSTGRPYDITRALILAGFLMILQNPKILVFDSSFQLSFMSTLALIYVSPLLEKRFQFVTEKFGLRGVVVATLATQIFVLPMLLYKMGELSLVALPVNLLILLAIPITMFFGFFTGMAGFLSSTLSFPFAFVTYGLLNYELTVVEFFSHLPFSVVALAGFPLWLAIVWYGFYGVLFFGFRGKKKVQAISQS